MAITLSMSFFFRVYAQRKRFVGTINYTGRYVLLRAKVTLDNSFAIHVSTKRPVRARYYACPTADTPFYVNNNHVTYRVFIHRACKTGINTPGLSALTTLNRKRNLYISLHAYTRQGTGSFLFECLDYVLRLRVLHLAIDLAQATTNTDLLLNVYSFHT
jgi:hypothetical protein